jgi:hypothetical protein
LFVLQRPALLSQGVLVHVLGVQHLDPRRIGCGGLMEGGQSEGYQKAVNLRFCIAETNPSLQDNPALNLRKIDPYKLSQRAVVFSR